LDNRIAAVALDRSGTVWAGTVDEGLTRYDPQTDRFEVVAGPEGEFEYAADYIWPIIEDRSGSLWFGASGPNGGIHRLSPDRTELSTWVTGGDPSRPNAGRVTTLEVSGDTIVWFGTQGAGLGRLQVVSGRTQFYTTEDGLPHYTVAGIIEDTQGYLWVSTEWGMARFDPEMEEFWVFGEESGLQSNRFYFNSSFRSDDGLLYFGGPNGVSIIDPTVLPPPTAPPPLALTRFSVRGQEWPDVNHHTAQSGLDLAPGNNFFTLELAALDFADVTLTEYRYRLDPLDQDWVVNGSSSVANYTSVPPHEYTFRAQVRRRGSAWQGSGVSIPITVHPFYYQTWWFQSAVVLAVLSLISGLYLYRLRQLQARQQLRLDIAGRLHDDIGANLSTIALKAGMVQMASSLDEKRKAHLHDMAHLARDSAHKVRETVWVVNTRYDTLAGLISKMRDTADVILEGHVAYTFEEPTTLPDMKLKMETRQNIYLMFKETLHNVVKHASASTVQVDVEVEGTELMLTVEDDGVGFVPGEGGEGSGQALLQHRASQCRGSAQVTSRPGEGTRVEVRARLR
jgi:signal transduction histidine kinase/streptogramin lyase